MRQLRLRTPALIAGILALAIGGGYVAGHRRPAEALSRSHRPGMESALALQQTFADVAGEVEPAVVSVKIEKTVRQMEWRRAPRGRRGPFQYYEAPGAEQSVPIGEGSGVIFRPDGYALTNYHVVQHADTLKVKLHDGRELPAEVVGTDELLDLAVIKINSREKFTAAELGDFVKAHPEGLDYSLTEAGEGMSSGQKQRLCLARALLSSPPLLILDEVSSNLDDRTEAAIAETLSKLKGKTTILIVSHRAGMIRFADSILDLDSSHQ